MKLEKLLVITEWFVNVMILHCFDCLKYVNTNLKHVQCYAKIRSFLITICVALCDCRNVTLSAILIGRCNS